MPRDFDLIEIPFQERGGPELVKSGARLPRAEVPSAHMSAAWCRSPSRGTSPRARRSRRSSRPRASTRSSQTADEDDPLTVVVPESSLEAAQDAIEALTEPDELTAEP